MKKILVVEDNELLRENIVEILELEGFEVSEAEDGNHGIKAALELKPDLIISDVNMPGKDGFEMLEELRTYAETKITPFIFLTVKNTMRDLRDGMSLGADDYITKPFDMEDLISAVKKRLSMRKEIVAKEVDKYDKLKESVGTVINSVIDEPLKSIERLASILQTEAHSLKAADVSEISKILCQSAGRLRNEITHILFYQKAAILKDRPDELEKYKHQVSKNVAEPLKKVSEKVADEFKRTQDLQVMLADNDLQVPEEFLTYITKELVDNAFKYSPKNTLVKVTGINDNGTYNLIVQDAGIGFPKKSLDDFQPYIRSREDQIKGLGLSLYNIKNLVELFNGKISVSSEEGVGTSFNLILPKA